MGEKKEPQSIADIFKQKKQQPAPAYQWQDLALHVIKELRVPNFKRNSVFKACKENTRSVIEKCMNDTKELCRTGDQWKYFFKIINK